MPRPLAKALEKCLLLFLIWIAEHLDESDELPDEERNDRKQYCNYGDEPPWEVPEATSLNNFFGDIAVLAIKEIN